jgi:hypothetical protein
MAASTVVVDYGATATSVAVLAGAAVQPLHDPDSGRPRWPSGIYRDGSRLLTGSDAERHRARHPAAYRTELRNLLGETVPPVLDQVPVPVVELVAAALRAVGELAEGHLGRPPQRSALTVPVSWAPYGPQRAALLEAAELAGLPDAALVEEPIAAYHAVPAELRPAAGATVLVYDLGAHRFTGSVLRVLPDGAEVAGWLTRTNLGPAGQPMLDATVDACRELLGSLDLNDADLDLVVLVGGRAQAPRVRTALGAALGRPMHCPSDPGTAIVLGAAAYLAAADRQLMPAGAAVRQVPVRWPLPPGRAELLRWLVADGDRVRPGDVLTRVRSGGDVWDLCADRAGRVVARHAEPGDDVDAGRWLVTIEEPIAGRFWSPVLLAVLPAQDPKPDVVTLAGPGLPVYAHRGRIAVHSPSGRPLWTSPEPWWGAKVAARSADDTRWLLADKTLGHLLYDVTTNTGQPVPVDADAQQPAVEAGGPTVAWLRRRYRKNRSVVRIWRDGQIQEHVHDGALSGLAFVGAALSYHNQRGAYWFRGGPRPEVNFAALRTAVVSPDGSVAAGGTSLLNTRTGRKLRYIDGVAGDPRLTAFDPAGALLATGPWSGGPDRITVVDTATGKTAVRLDPPGPVAALRFAADGALLALTRAEQLTLHRWEPVGG